MLRQLSVFAFGPLALLAIVGLLILAADAQAGPWETLFSAKTGGVEAKVELKSSSLRTRLVRGEKIISAHIRSYLNDGLNRSTASGDYEIHCAARSAYRSNLTMEVVAKDRTTSTVSTASKTPLAGQELSDFVGVMDILCTR